MIRRFLFAVVAALLLATPVFAQPTPTRAPEVDADGLLVFFRRVSDRELPLVLEKKGLEVAKSEKFVSTSREYVDQLAARHPELYANLLIIKAELAVMAALEKIGLRAPGKFIEALYPNMKPMTKDRHDAVHFKGELDVLNLGFRTGSVEVFNRFVRSIHVESGVPPPILNRAPERTRSTGMAEVLDARTRAATDRDKATKR